MIGEAFPIRLSPCFRRSHMEIRIHGVRVIAAQSFRVFDRLLCACSCYHAIRGFHNIELRACAKSLHRGQVPLEDSLFHTSTARGSHLSRRSSPLSLSLSLSLFYLCSSVLLVIRFFEKPRALQSVRLVHDNAAPFVSP